MISSLPAQVTADLPAPVRSWYPKPAIAIDYLLEQQSAGSGSLGTNTQLLYTTSIVTRDSRLDTQPKFEPVQRHR